MIDSYLLRDKPICKYRYLSRWRATDSTTAAAKIKTKVTTRSSVCRCLQGYDAGHYSSNDRSSLMLPPHLTNSCCCCCCYYTAAESDAVAAKSPFAVAIVTCDPKAVYYVMCVFGGRCCVPLNDQYAPEQYL